MININFNIALPWDQKFKNFWCRAWSMPWTNKFVELEVHTNESLVGFGFDWSTKCDHAGVDIQLSLFGICAHFNFYDCRHWDYDNNCWKMYG